ncbi:unnamed protein product [Moneuplotes crassus]|uniref:Uncharacterized protein n=1 Tax=Euplotes crassus TaxID=5936 RepID=A0AAD1XMH4_EUPCR|nr:unnamed protein product [Moneuplotes crassus]
MEIEEDQKETKPLTTKTFNELIRALDSQASHTSFGVLPLSVEKTAPNYSFPLAKKDDGDKIVTDQEMAKTQFASKHSPGPVYVYQDDTKYQAAPKFGFGTAPKIEPTKPKYDYYEIDKIIDYPIEADKARKKRCCVPKIGTEPRMPVSFFSRSPGPDYNVNQKPNAKNSEKYTFGYRRSKGAQDSLMNKTSTTKTVGPGRYVPESCQNPSNKKNNPKWTLPKARRSLDQSKSLTKHQTYDTRSSVGKQYTSKNKNARAAHFGTASRDAKVGHFRDTMAGAMKVRMPHASY